MAAIQMALVAHQSTIVVHDKLSPQVRPAAQKIVENLPRHDHKVTYQHGGMKYHCLVENQLSYVCIADVDVSTRTAYGFLEDIKTKFRTTFAGSSNNYPRGAELNPSSCAKFSPQIAASIRMFNENPDSDKIGKLKTQIEGVKQVMLQNIDEIMERGERIESLVEATSNLSTTAQNFEDNSRTLKRAMIMRNVKIMIAIVIALLILSLIIAMIACGVNFKKCQSDDDDGGNNNNNSPATTTAAPATAGPNASMVQALLA